MRSFRVLSGLVVVLALVLLTGCNVVRGSGNVKTETRDVSDFSAIELEGAGDLYITQGDEVSLTIEADDNVLPYLTSDVQGDTLVLSAKDEITFSNTSKVIYRITVPALSRITVSGAGDVYAEGLDLDSLDLEFSGASDATLSGTVAEVMVSISGAGNYDAENLKNEKTTLTISGAGDAVVNASDALDVTISGAGDVTYLGSPHVSQTISGIGSVKQK